MTDEELLRFARRIVAGVLNDCDPSDRKGIAEEVAVDLRAIARVAAAEERRSILHETGSTVVKACAALVRLSAPDDVDEHYVQRAAVVDIALGLQRDMKAIRSRSAAGGQGRGGGE